jgi:hypothetical protein
LKSGQAVWVVQAGWEVDLARELQSRVPEFHELTPQSFGRNIAIFKLKSGPTLPGVSALSN